jgi:hypothetical protein
MKAFMKLLPVLLILALAGGGFLTWIYWDDIYPDRTVYTVFSTGKRLGDVPRALSRNDLKNARREAGSKASNSTHQAYQFASAVTIFFLETADFAQEICSLGLSSESPQKVEELQSTLNQLKRDAENETRRAQSKNFQTYDNALKWLEHLDRTLIDSVRQISKWETERPVTLSKLRHYHTELTSSNSRPEEKIGKFIAGFPDDGNRMDFIEDRREKLSALLDLAKSRQLREDIDPALLDKLEGIASNDPTGNTLPGQGAAVALLASLELMKGVPDTVTKADGATKNMLERFSESPVLNNALEERKEFLYRLKGFLAEHNETSFSEWDMASLEGLIDEDSADSEYQAGFVAGLRKDQKDLLALRHEGDRIVVTEHTEYQSILRDFERRWGGLRDEAHLSQVHELATNTANHLTRLRLLQQEEDDWVRWRAMVNLWEDAGEEGREGAFAALFPHAVLDSLPHGHDELLGREVVAGAEKFKKEDQDRTRQQQYAEIEHLYKSLNERYKDGPLEAVINQPLPERVPPLIAAPAIEKLFAKHQGIDRKIRTLVVKEEEAVAKFPRATFGVEELRRWSKDQSLAVLGELKALEGTLAGTPLQQRVDNRREIWNRIFNAAEMCSTPSSSETTLNEFEKVVARRKIWNRIFQATEMRSKPSSSETTLNEFEKVVKATEGPFAHRTGEIEILADLLYARLCATVPVKGGTQRIRHTADHIRPYRRDQANRLEKLADLHESAKELLTHAQWLMEPIPRNLKKQGRQADRQEFLRKATQEFALRRDKARKHLQALQNLPRLGGADPYGLESQLGYLSSLLDFKLGDEEIRKDWAAEPSDTIVNKYLQRPMGSQQIPDANQIVLAGFSSYGEEMARAFLASHERLTEIRESERSPRNRKQAWEHYTRFQPQTLEEALFADAGQARLYYIYGPNSLNYLYQIPAGAVLELKGNPLPMKNKWVIPTRNNWSPYPRVPAKLTMKIEGGKNPTEVEIGPWEESGGKNVVKFTGNEFSNNKIPLRWNAEHQLNVSFSTIEGETIEGETTRQYKGPDGLKHFSQELGLTCPRKMGFPFVWWETVITPDPSPPSFKPGDVIWSP